MARKKSHRKKKSVSKKKPALKKKLTAKKKSSVRRKAAPKKKAAAKKAVGKKRLAKKKAAKKTPRRAARRPSNEGSRVNTGNRRGLGADSGGQSGDTQGLSRREFGGSESVEELLEEGQYAEAEAVSGVEDAPDADQGEVRTREVLEDDVPEEYLDRD
jgi:hypothetical protein